MPTGLQPPQECTSTCTSTTTAVPGPAGADGADGAAGSNGTNSYTALTAQFTMPAAQSSVATAARAANVATIVTSAAHNLSTGDTVDITGVVTAGFNDTDQTVTVTNATTFTYVNTGANVGATPETAGRVDPESDATVADASFLPVGGTPTSFPIVFLQNCGYLELMGASGNTLTLRNTGWDGNVAAGSAVATANKLGMAGPQGDDGAAGASGAPVDARYLVQTADATLTTEFNLGGLTTGLLKHTVAAGVSTPATATADVDYLAVDAGLLDLAGVAMAADKAYYTTADNTHAAMDVTAFARTILDDADAATVRSTLGLGSAATFASSAFMTAANNLSDVADTATSRANLGIENVGADLIILQDQKSAGTDGGAFNSGAWQTRDLNAEVSDTGNHCTLAANQFLLLAGTYRIKAVVPAHKVGNHKARLYNITDAAVELAGTSATSSTTDGTSNASIIEGVFTIASTKTLEIQHQCETTRAADGFGIGYDFGVAEIFTTVKLEREAG